MEPKGSKELVQRYLANPDSNLEVGEGGGVQTQESDVVHTTQEGSEVAPLQETVLPTSLDEANIQASQVDLGVDI